MADIYKIETIEDYADDAATEAALNAEGQDGWDVVDITYVPNTNGKSTATIIFKGSSSSSSVSISSSSASSSSSSSTSSSSTSSSSSSTSVSPLQTFLIHAPAWNNGQGVVLESPGSQSFFSAEGMSYEYRSAMLPDGRAVVPGYKSPDDEVWVHCYEAGSTTILSWSYKILGSAYANYSDACVLINGNIVVMWVDNVSPENAYFAILDTDGGLVKGMTSCEPLDEYLANYSEPNHVIALADGGFFCYWMLDDTYPSGSVFDADGTVRVDYYWYGSEIEPAAPIQMPLGGGTYAGWLVVSDSYESNSLRFVNQADMEDQVTNIAPYITSNPDWIYMASPPAWTDRIAVLWGSKYMIVDDEGVSDGAHSILFPGGGPPVSRVISDLVQLPDGNLLYMDSGPGSDNGAEYYILDTSDDSELTVLSGPHIAFTGLSADPDPACHGCADKIETWTSIFDNTNWVPDTYGSWDGSEWDAGEVIVKGGSYYRLTLLEIGTWVEGFRPTKIRVTHNSDDMELLTLRDSLRDTIAFTTSYISQTEVVITFGADDISELNMSGVLGYPGDSFSVTNIEFNAHSSSSSSSISSSSSSSSST